MIIDVSRIYFFESLKAWACERTCAFGVFYWPNIGKFARRQCSCSSPCSPLPLVSLVERAARKCVRVRVCGVGACVRMLVRVAKHARRGRENERTRRVASTAGRPAGRILVTWKKRSPRPRMRTELRASPAPSALERAQCYCNLSYCCCCHCFRSPSLLF